MFWNKTFTQYLEQTKMHQAFSKIISNKNYKQNYKQTHISMNKTEVFVTHKLVSIIDMTDI